MCALSHGVEFAIATICPPIRPSRACQFNVANVRWARFKKRIGAGFEWLHRAIVSAKLRRLQSRMMFRHDTDEMFPLERDLSKHAQRPLILGDKWDSSAGASGR